MEIFGIKVALVHDADGKLHHTVSVKTTPNGEYEPLFSSVNECNENGCAITFSHDKLG
jgi:hypothetical protein